MQKLNGSQCAKYDYLSRVDRVCVGEKHLYKDYHNEPYAKPNYDVQGLMNILADPLFEWFRERITWSWPTWIEAVKSVTRNNKRLKYKRKNVVIYMGAILLEPEFFYGAKKGGPLGELIQWADVIAANYILGYNVKILSITELQKYVTIRKTTSNTRKCAPKILIEFVDVLYTDIMGTVLFQNNYDIRGSSNISCMYRVLDSFGTFPEFNFHRHPFQEKTVYGNRNLLMPQFLNFFPHTHDNSFLGFVVDNKWKTKENNKDMKTMTAYDKKKEDIALVYGKQCHYMKGNQRYIEIVAKYFEVHVTCVDDAPIKYLPTMPFIAVNHGVVNSSRVQELLRNSKIFIGLGFPYEGPGPLEAMAAGTVFLQPKFNPPKNKFNTKFFKGKPTNRILRSQSPYMEEVIGEPYCFTINIHDEKELRRTLAKIRAMSRLSGKIPKDYTSVGFLERIIVFNDKMDFCNPYAPRWPPMRNLIVLYGTKGKSCKETCMTKELFCEHTYFDKINSVETIEKYSGHKCTSVRKGEFDLHAPSYDSKLKTCYIKQGFMFSCMHVEKDVNRICPCRNYENGQTAICKGCL